MANPVHHQSGKPYFQRIAIVEDQGNARNAVAADQHELAIVVRGMLRAALFQCPCGCGEILSMNLDPRAGTAWRVYADESSISLLPSVWRTSGCRSHFFVVHNDIYWCSADWQEEWLDGADLATIARWFRRE